MGMDERLSRLPVVGFVVRRLYAYFRGHIFFADAVHLMLGVGLGVLIAGESFTIVGAALVLAGVLGHVYAYIRGGPSH